MLLFSKKTKAQGALEYLLILAGTIVIAISVLMSLSSEPMSSNIPYQVANGLCAPYSFGLCPTADPDGNPDYYLCKWDSTTNRCIAKRCSEFSADECPTDQHCKLEYNQCIPLYSHATYQFSMNQEVGETIFNSGGTYWLAPAEIGSNNFVIFYQHSTGGAYVQSSIVYDSTGTKVKDENIEHPFYDSYKAATKLNNGNVVWAYRDLNNNKYPTFRIYNTNMEQVVGSTVIDTNEILSYISAATLSNGNFVIAYQAKRTGTNYEDGKFAIYSPTGTLLIGPIIFDSCIANVSKINVVALDNGNLVLVYRRETDGYFKIYDSSGNLVKDATTFGSGLGYYRADYINATKLANGNFVIAWQKYVQFGDDPGHFAIYDSSGNLVKAETEFESNEVDAISVLGKSTGEFIIAYRDNNDYKGYFKVYNSDGSLQKDKTLFANHIYSSPYNYKLKIFELSNNKIVFVYYTGSNGVFQIWS